MIRAENPSTPLSPLDRERRLRVRALAVLGLVRDEPPDLRRIQYGYHCRMLRWHPDRCADNPLAQKAAALINEAYSLARGKPTQPQLLLDDELVREICEESLGELAASLKDAPSYEEWLRGRFLDVEHSSIWPVD